MGCKQDEYSFVGVDAGELMKLSSIISIFKPQFPNMKKILILALFLFVLSVCGQKPFELNYRYSIDFKYCAETDITLDYDDSIIQKPSIKEQNDLVNFVINTNEKVKNREAIAYNADIRNIDFFPLGDEEIDHLQYMLDTLLIDDGNGQLISRSIKSDFDYGQTAYLRLFQEWYYNTNKNKIEVIVNAYSPVFAVGDNTELCYGTKPMYWIKQYSRSSLMHPNKMLSSVAIPWAHQVQFQIPVKNSPKYLLLSNQRDEISIKKTFDLELPALLFKQALNNKVEIYSPQTGKKMNVNELKELLTVIDTIMIENLRGELEMRLISNEMGLENLSSMLVNQTFIFDPKTLIITSRINSVIVTCKRDEEFAPIELFEVRFSN